MNKNDRKIKQKIDCDLKVPVSIHQRIEDTLDCLPPLEENKKSSHTYVFKLALCFVICFIILPNFSVSYANALEKIPLIGQFVKVITIRNYYSHDHNHEIDMTIPQVDHNSAGINIINADVKELTDLLIKEYQEDIKNNGSESHNSLLVDYKVVMNNDYWFTLKLVINESTGSSYTYYKYYHLNKSTGQNMILADVINDAEGYKVIEEDIKRQMKLAMESNNELVYWVEGSEIGDDFVTVDGKHNFYWDKEFNLVIPFDKYEAAPGYMGTFEFKVDKKLIEEYMNPSLKNMG